MTNIQPSIHRLLEQELGCFNEIFSETESYLRKFDPFSLNTFAALIYTRQEFIDLIKDLETQIKQYDDCDHSEQEEFLKKEISNVARLLIVVDAKILDLLQPIKAEYLNSLANILDSRIQSGLRKHYRVNNHVDILQE